MTAKSFYQKCICACLSFMSLASAIPIQVPPKSSLVASNIKTGLAGAQNITYPASANYKKRDDNATPNAGHQLCFDRSREFQFHSQQDLSAFKIENCPNAFYVANDMMVWEQSSATCAPTAAFPEYISQGGLWEMELQTAPMSGMVTAFVMYGPGAIGQTDEVDYEWVGLDPGNAQSMYFVNGQRIVGETRTPARDGSNMSQTFHKYGIEYNKDYINWWIDGTVIRTLIREDGKPFPGNLGIMKFGLWDGSGTHGWAGTVDWSQGPFRAYVKSIKYTPYC